MLEELKKITDEGQIHFASDNNSGILPEVMDALTIVNQNHVASYGNDAYTELADKEIKRLFGDCDIFYVFNGTAANVVAIKSLLKSYEAIICSSESHLQKDECGAPEANLGSKLLLCPSKDGKLNLEEIKKQMIRLGDVHHVQAKMISVTQPTEYGTCYSYEELKKISDYAKENGLYLHMDGSRLVNASIYLKRSLKEITKDLGFDIVSFGGTKNGLLGGEAILSFHPEATKSLKYYRKQSMQLAGKMRFLSTQFYAWLKDDLWKRYSSQTLELTKYMANSLHEIPGIEVTQKIESNAIFVKMPKEVCKQVKKDFFFYIWDERTWEARLMLSFDTKKEDVDRFIEAVRKYQ